MTPRQARRQRTADWNRAIAEGRVVKFADSFKAFATKADANQAIDLAFADGRAANIVEPALADLSREQKPCAECNGTGRLTKLGGDWGKTQDTEVPCWRCK